MSKITKKGEEQKQKILNSAAHCIAELGIEKSSITKIAAHANVPRSLVAYYLPKKADLVLNIMDMLLIQAYSFIENPPDHLSLVEQVLYSHKANTKFLDDYPHLFNCMLLSYNYAIHDIRLKNLIDQIIFRAEERLLVQLKLQNKISKNLYEESDLRRFSKIFFNIMGMHLMKRRTTHVKNLKKFDQQNNKSIREYWGFIFRLPR